MTYNVEIILHIISCNTGEFGDVRLIEKRNRMTKRIHIPERAMMPTLSLTPGLQGECTGAIKLKKLEKILIAVYDEYCNKPDASCSI